MSVFCPVIFSQSSSEILLRSLGALSAASESESMTGAGFLAAGFLSLEQIRYSLHFNTCFSVHFNVHFKSLN